MAARRTVRMLVAAVVVIGVVAVTGLLAALGVIAAKSSPVATRTTTPSSPVTLNAVAASPDTVTVVGSGQVNAAPDQALLSLGVSTTRPTAADALNATGAELTHLIAAMHGQGVADQDMQTSSVSLGSATTCCPNAVTGYTGSSSLTMTIHHLANVGSIEVAAVGAVGNDLQLSGVSLTLSDDSSQLRAARVAAIADARSRGDQWAAQTGRTLGQIIAVSEIANSQSSGSSCTTGCGGASGGVPIQAGQNTVSVNITVEFQLQ